MALGYGSQFELAGLTSVEVGVVIDQKKSGYLISLLRIVVTIAEVGASLITANPLVGTAIALAAAGANTAIDYSQGEISPVNLGINFGAALIPGASAGIKELNTIRQGYNVLDKLGDTASAVSKTTDSAINPASKFFSSPIEEGYTTSLADMSNRQVGKMFQEIKSAGGTAGGSGGLSFSANAATKDAISNSIKNAFGVSNRAITVGSESLENVEEDVRKIEFASGINKAEAMELERLLSGVVTQEERSVVTIKFLRSINKLDSLRTLAPLATDVELAAILRNGNKAILDNPGFISKIKTKTRKWLEALGKPNSSEFNDNFVQKVQLLFDGNDAGRAPIEFAYGKIKQYINKEFRKLAKIINKADKLDEAFTKTGGVVVDSDVILGYKIISSIGYQSLVQISFYTQATKSHKNPSGKEPVYVFASKSELKRLRRLGMSYYLKKWATSKNGRGGGAFATRVRSLFGGLTFFSGMFKINAIRNILSLASNMSTGFFGKGGIGAHGMFTTAWEKKFASSFSRNWKNRVGRLTGRVIVGGIATTFLGHTIGSFIGREAQRASSQYVIPVLTGKTMGNWKVALATSLQSTMRRVARRRNGNTGALKSLSMIRNGQIVQRVPGSFTAGSLALSNLKIKIPR